MDKLDWLVPGGACEVLMQEEGLWGSHYTAKILEVTKQKAKVEFDVRRPQTLDPISNASHHDRPHRLVLAPTGVLRGGL